MKKRILTLLITTFALGAFAQSESGLWMGVDASHDFANKKWNMELGIGGRLEDNWSQFSRYDAALGLNYKPAKWLKLGVAYDFICDYSQQEISVKYKKNPDGSVRYDSDGNPVWKGLVIDEPYWRSKHRFYFEATAKHKVGRFEFSLRERYQYTLSTKATVTEQKYYTEMDEEEFEDYKGLYCGPYPDKYGDNYYYGLSETAEDEKSLKHKHYLRSRLGVAYNIRHCPVTPFANYELSNDLASGFDVVRHRTQLGIDWKITKGHTVSAAYLYQHGALEESGDNDLHVLSVGYSFKF